MWPCSGWESERTHFPGVFFGGFCSTSKRADSQRQMLALLFITVYTLNSIMCSSPEHFVTMRLTSKRKKYQQAKDSGTLILDLPAFRMVRDKQLLFISCPIYGILLYSPNQLRQALMSLMREKLLQEGDKWNERSQGMRGGSGHLGNIGAIHPLLPFEWDLTHDSRIEACEPKVAI